MSATQALPARLVNRLVLTRLGQTVAIELALLALVWKLLRPAGRRILGRAEHMVVGHSLRRVRAWGPRRTPLWCRDRRYQPDSASEMNVR